MAGINAQSSSSSHTNDGVDSSTTGFLAGEPVTLTDSVSGTIYSWSLSLPNGSNALRVGLSGEDEATAYFTPDVTGTYTATLIVDGVTHVLRIGAVDIAVTPTLAGVRLQPVANSQIPTPIAGVTFFYSSTEDAFAVKDSSGDVFTVDLTAT